MYLKYTKPVYVFTYFEKLLNTSFYNTYTISISISFFFHKTDIIYFIYYINYMYLIWKLVLDIFVCNLVLYQSDSLICKHTRQMFSVCNLNLTCNYKWLLTVCTYIHSQNVCTKWMYSQAFKQNISYHIDGNNATVSSSSFVKSIGFI